MILRNRNNHSNVDDFLDIQEIIQIWMILRYRRNHPNMDDFKKSKKSSKLGWF